jgi:predicted aspartyl protease
MLWAVPIAAVTAWMAAPPQTVALERLGPYLIAPSVYLNGSGPLRLLVDTGAQSSAISPQVAARLRIEPKSRVHQMTAAGESLVAVAPAVSASLPTATGVVVIGNIEVLISPLNGVLAVDPRINGMLGHNMLAGRSYALDYAARTLTLDPPTEMFQGERIPFVVRDGRIAIEISIAGRLQTVVLDSGVPCLILFGATGNMPAHSTAVLSTNSGHVPVPMTEVRARIGRSISMRLATAATPNHPSDSVAGLLNTSAFRSIYVNAPSQYVVLNPR